MSGRNYTDATSSSSISNNENLFEPARFALENFKKVYVDTGYVVLVVPEDLLSAKEVPISGKSDEAENLSATIPSESGDFIKLPGEISDRAKRGGAEVPWQSIMGSESSLALAILIPSVAFIFGYWSVSRRTKSGQSTF